MKGRKTIHPRVHRVLKSHQSSENVLWKRSVDSGRLGGRDQVDRKRQNGRPQKGVQQSGKILSLWQQRRTHHQLKVRQLVGNDGDGPEREVAVHQTAHGTDRSMDRQVSDRHVAGDPSGVQHQHRQRAVGERQERIG